MNFHLHPIPNLEILPMLSNKEIDPFISYIFDKPYQFFMVDRHTQQICKNFNPLTITTARGDTYPLEYDDKKKIKNKENEKKKGDKITLSENEYKE